MAVEAMWSQARYSRQTVACGPELTKDDRAYKAEQDEEFQAVNVPKNRYGTVSGVVQLWTQAKFEITEEWEEMTVQAEFFAPDP
ncbi:hypothetical protein H310_15015 [Aphanomyces invadans]|uniref:Uncharacterized protein n=1 Tax=Aphanomyces invadans TaxID=157072 RepID=A0A024T947_9STRA|nr:hypothetical protein H310_15015 [Aphanomyces invadans]ETV90151.1 hypothetical protein H310_15015 [Aphanomyces invadans]|eukprot:XP_008881217.1 hypothetical protein H310_15015 [Aphanomyces invadans]